jgi:urease accessory protein
VSFAVKDHLSHITGSSIAGHLHLTCEVKENGIPFLTQQSFHPPIHLSKPHLSDDEKFLVVTLINPTAGFFDGDTVCCNISVAENARLILSTPSSSRVFRTRSGRPATCEQRFHVAKNGFLEWIPEAFIPHAGASYFQKTAIHLEPEADLLYIDWLSPGRVARGEIFQYDSLRMELDLFLDGKLLARERYILPGDSLEGVSAMFTAGHYISVYLAGKMSAYFSKEKVSALENENTYLGYGTLEGGKIHVIRALCRDSLSARRLIESLRPILYRSASHSTPSLGRIFM